MRQPLKVFITYSHDDTEKGKKLQKCLALMEQKRVISLWDDNEMIPGDKWEEEISNNLNDADILFYLVSASSLASKSCNRELGEALSSKIRVIPIVLERCDWQNHKLSGYEVLPAKGRPINEWRPKSKGWQNVVDGIRKVVSEIQARKSDSDKGERLPEWIFAQGNFLMMLGEINKSIEAYSHVIKITPSYAEAYNNRGVAYDKRGIFDCTVADFSKAIELNPALAVAYSNRGAAYSDKERYDLAILNFDQAIALAPNYPEAYCNRGFAYRMKGELDLAIEDCGKAIELKPKLAEAYFHRGAAYGLKEELDLAIADYTSAIELRADFADAYFNRGNTYGRDGEDDQAIEDYNKAIKLKSEDAGFYNNRGSAYRRKHEVDRAIQDYDRAIELKPDEAVPYFNRGNAYGSKGKLDRAIQDYTKAIELEPDYADAYFNRGFAYGSIGNLDQAIHNYTNVIELKPDDADAYYNRGAAYSDKGARDSALKDYNNSIELNPELAVAYFSRGMYWLQSLKWREAKSDLIAAKSTGLDIIATFRSVYGSVEAYERINQVKLPDDIGVMLTQQRRSRFPKPNKFLNKEDQLLNGNSIPSESPDATPPESPDVLNLRAKLENIGTPLSKYLHTKQGFGIKTGCNEAFVVDRVTRDKLIAEHPSSADILKPFLHGRNIRRWQVEATYRWLIFAYRGIEINSHPAILKHLEKYRDSLNKRRSKQKWYELQVGVDHSKRFTQTKLVSPSFYNHQTFAVDTDGFFCDRTCYLIPTEERWLCGILNSRVAEWFYSQVSRQLSGNELRARSRYMQLIPVPSVTSSQKTLVSKFVDYLIYLQGQPTTNSKDLAYARDYVMLRYFERIIDGLVYECYLSEELRQGGKYFLEPLLEEQLPQLKEIQGAKMSSFRRIFEQLYEKAHPVRRNLFFLDSLKPVRIIEGKV